MAILRKVRLGFQCIVVCLLAMLISNLSIALEWKSVELSDCFYNTNGSANGSCIFNGELDQSNIMRIKKAFQD